MLEITSQGLPISNIFHWWMPPRTPLLCTPLIPVYFRDAPPLSLALTHVNYKNTLCLFTVAHCRSYTICSSELTINSSAYGFIPSTSLVPDFQTQLYWTQFFVKFVNEKCKNQWQNVYHIRIVRATMHIYSKNKSAGVDLKFNKITLRNMLWRHNRVCIAQA